jgi:hypothetical protein
MTQLTTYYSLHNFAKIFYSGAGQTGVYFITKQCLDPENGVTKLLQDVSNYLPINMATYPRTPEYSRGTALFTSNVAGF